MDDLISRQAAIDALARTAREKYEFSHYLAGLMDGETVIQQLPSAQPEITHEAAVEYLQSTGWMQQHDREMYEMGLKVQLADDSGSYSALAEPHKGGQDDNCK